MTVSPALKVDPHNTLWVTDAELIRRSGVPERIHGLLPPTVSANHQYSGSGARC